MPPAECLLRTTARVRGAVHPEHMHWSEAPERGAGLLSSEAPDSYAISHEELEALELRWHRSLAFRGVQTTDDNGEPDHSGSSGGDGSSSSNASFDL